MSKAHASRRDLQCFMARVLTSLRVAPQTGRVKVDEEARSDKAWFVKHAEASNGCLLLCPTLNKIYLECDACLEGGLGFSSTHSKSVRFPLEWIVRHHISQLEALNVIIALKSLIPDDLHSTEIVIRTDNIASAYSLTNGKAKDPVIASCARELWLIAATRQLIITVPGESLVLANTPEPPQVHHAYSYAFAPGTTANLRHQAKTYLYFMLLN